MKKYYAHSTDTEDKSDWQLLEEHLQHAAKLAKKFAAVFGAAPWGECAGLLHDAGKATEAFQHRLEGQPIRVDHSTFGAKIAWQKFGSRGLLLAYAIAGHHTGLPDGGEQQGQLHYRLKHSPVPKDAGLLQDMDCFGDLKLPFRLSRDQANRAGFSLSFFTRMIFSCLVDADFLDTERFCSPDRFMARKRWEPKTAMPLLKDRFMRHMTVLADEARKSEVNGVRDSVFRQCLDKAVLPNRFFSLTVPTGGGKTLSSLGFALEHACLHKMNRIIYTIPFTSIIEQNAGVFKEILGRDMVLEHHCNIIENNDDNGHSETMSQRLASENWDMPVVVTTNVQFFESLFACKASRCRKLHNIAGSVIVLDEAQAIPTSFLKPCLLALQELVEQYRCTVVLCTATQPALDDMQSLADKAITEITEIVDEPGRIFQKLKRVTVEFIGRKSNRELAELLASEEQGLCIVSTKPQARKVYEHMRQSGNVFHLSTNMYPLHRQRALQEVRERLHNGEPCRVVSTSLVEAGVDLDFPVVYRAMAGLDSIAQAAGRCNREGHLNEQGRLGRVYVFEPESLPSMPWLKRCITRTKEAFRSLPNRDPLSMEMIRRYFELLYDVQELDNKGILQLLNPRPLDPELLFHFREAATLFKFIEEDTVDVILPLEPETDSLIQELRYAQYTRTTLRKLQPYTVSVRWTDIQALVVGGGVEVINDRFYVLCNHNAYNIEVGLCVDKAGSWDIEQLVF